MVLKRGAIDSYRNVDIKKTLNIFEFGSIVVENGPPKVGKKWEFYRIRCFSVKNTNENQQNVFKMRKLRNFEI